MKLKLTVEPIPENNWHLSLANLLPKPIWDTLRREVYFKAGYICEICSACDCEVHCHEVWFYNDKKGLQILSGLLCVCKDCHDIKHWGRTVHMVHEGKYPGDTIPRLTKHFCQVNGCTERDFELHKIAVGELTQMRSKKKYKIDFGLFKVNRIIDEWIRENPKRKF